MIVPNDQAQAKRGSTQDQTQPPAQPVDQRFILMAAALMHKEGRLISKEAPAANDR